MLTGLLVILSLGATALIVLDVVSRLAKRELVAEPEPAPRQPQPLFGVGSDVPADAPPPMTPEQERLGWQAAVDDLAAANRDLRMKADRLADERAAALEQATAYRDQLTTLRKRYNRGVALFVNTNPEAVDRVCNLSPASLDGMMARTLLLERAIAYWRGQALLAGLANERNSSRDVRPTLDLSSPEVQQWLDGILRGETKS
jgi:hypothetical protein